MSFRQSVHNLIRSDRPESPTNTIFIVLVLFLIAWETYALLMGKTVPNIEALLTFITAIKVAKVYSDRKTPPATRETQEPTNVPA